jgi:Resolvase, N terminal domain
VDRPKLAELLRFVRDGDGDVVHSLDRLGRNLDDLRRLVGELTGRGVRVEFVTEQLVFSGEDSPMAQLLLSVMGAFAEFERALIRRGLRGRTGSDRLHTGHAARVRRRSHRRHRQHHPQADGRGQAPGLGRVRASAIEGFPTPAQRCSP